MQEHNTKKIFTPEQTAQVVAYHNGEFETRSELVAAAFNFVAPPPALHPKINSSCMHRYFSMAGLVGKNKLNGSDNYVRDASPLDAIHAAEKAICDALLDLDAERNQLQARIKEIDDLVAKYRKV